MTVVMNPVQLGLGFPYDLSLVVENVLVYKSSEPRLSPYDASGNL